MFRLLDNKFTFKELKTDEKMCWRIHFSTIEYLQKAPITTSSENVPDS